MPLQGFARAVLPQQLEALIDALHLVFGLDEMLLKQLNRLQGLSKGSLGIGVLCSDRSASVRGESK